MKDSYENHIFQNYFNDFLLNDIKFVSSLRKSVGLVTDINF